MSQEPSRKKVRDTEPMETDEDVKEVHDPRVVRVPANFVPPSRREQAERLYRTCQTLPAPFNSFEEFAMAFESADAVAVQGIVDEMYASKQRFQELLLGNPFER